MKDSAHTSTSVISAGLLIIFGCGFLHSTAVRTAGNEFDLAEYDVQT